MKCVQRRQKKTEMLIMWIAENQVIPNKDTLQADFSLWSSSST